MIVLAKLKGISGTLDTTTNIFTPKEWSIEETTRYNAIVVEEIVLAKLNDVTGVLNKVSNTFVPRQWTEEETNRYNAVIV
jgi:hypothetical protein